MPDMEKVIRGLAQVSEYTRAKADIAGVGKGKEIFDSWFRAVEDAIALLRGQEPRVLTLGEATGGDECWFEHINGACGYADLYVHENGMVGVSRINKIISFIWAESYGKQWRCWSYRPTDEQRKAVKWND